MGFTYSYKDCATHWYKGHSIRRTWSQYKGRYIYQIDDEAIDAPLEKRELTTMKKVQEYIDKRIENRNRIINQIKDIAAANESCRIWVTTDDADYHLHIDIKL